MQTLLNAPARGGFNNVTPNQIDAHRAQLRIVDVRGPDEFVGELGHIPEAELVPLGNLMTAARTWPKDQELVVVCRSGGRSAQAADALAGVGFTHVHNMLGGMLRWQSEGRTCVR